MNAPHTYTFDCARDGDIFSSEYICETLDEAWEKAVAEINATWGPLTGEIYETWDDMTADMDGAAIIEHPAVMAPRIPQSEMDALRGLIGQISRMTTQAEAQADGCEDLGNDEAMDGLIRRARAVAASMGGEA